MKLTPVIEEQLEFEETLIKKQFDKNYHKEKKKKRIHLTDQFADAFEELNKTERIQLFCNQIAILKKVFENQLPSLP